MIPYQHYSFIPYSPYIHYVYHNPNGPYFRSYFPSRVLPPINPTYFMSSALQMQLVMKDASVLLEKIANSRKFSIDIMSAAQQSQKSKVEELIKSTGITKQPKVSYSPDGLTLAFTDEHNHIDCCHLTLKIRWS